MLEAPGHGDAKAALQIAIMTGLDFPSGLVKLLIVQ